MLCWASREHTAAVMPTWSLPMTVTMAFIVLIPFLIYKWYVSTIYAVLQLIQGELKTGEKLLHKVLQGGKGVFFQGGQGLLLGLLKLVVARLQFLHTLEIAESLSAALTRARTSGSGW